MSKNGLFLVSIGLLLFMFSVNRVTLKYDFLLMATAIFMVVVGIVLLIKENKRMKNSKDKGHS